MLWEIHDSQKAVLLDGWGLEKRNRKLQLVCEGVLLKRSSRSPLSHCVDSISLAQQSVGNIFLEDWLLHGLTAVGRTYCFQDWVVFLVRWFHFAGISFISLFQLQLYFSLSLGVFRGSRLASVLFCLGWNLQLELRKQTHVGAGNEEQVSPLATLGILIRVGS